ncbi:endonuclease/exonuclease/phosphatase family protein [Anabaena cylindrica]|uniref:endonuclease/exonuclease/phosphatase family protein n=1 Tax=Anabaena cylindrica TaxID=1165 RepID=UPI001F5541CF|nr:endonuclease/exonuclease/phosphatase family protein [Anabaena cylindrica]
MKIATINILFKLNYWTQRRQLLIDGLKAENPDIIALQEVSLSEDTSAWIAEQLGSGKYVVIIKLGATTRIIMMNKIPDSTNMII